MDTEKIKYQDVKGYSEEIHKLASDMKDIINEIKNNVNRLKSSGYWEGNASDYYISKTEKLIKNYDEIYVELENSVLYLANVTEGYQEIDETVMKEVCNNLNISEPSLNTSKIFN